nr:melanoma-associated antigen 1-like [Bubalus bubalis]
MASLSTPNHVDGHSGTEYDDEGQKTSKRNLEKENPIICHSVDEAQKAQVCATIYSRVVPPFLSQGLQEPAGEGRCLRPESIVQRAEEVQAVPRVKAQDPHLSPCFTPVCTSTLVIMQGMHELCQPERVFQDPRKEEGLMEAQFIWDALRVKKNELVQFLLSRCLAKELITKAEVLNSVLKDYQDHFLVVFGQASEYLQLVFGLEGKEVDPREHTDILVPSLGLTLSEMLSNGQRLPKASLLVVILCLIAVEDGHTPEEEIWGALSRMRVPDEDPACYEFLCGPQGYVETSKFKQLEYLDRVG